MIFLENCKLCEIQVHKGEEKMMQNEVDGE